MARGVGKLSRATALVMASGMAGCVAVGLAGCGTVIHEVRAGSTVTVGRTTNGAPRARPQVIEPSAGEQPVVTTPVNPVGDPNAHATPLSEIRRELRSEYVATSPSTAGYINPLYYVTCCGRWERTDQGVDANMPIGAPILAPGRVKILAVEPNWYAGQPLVYWELLDGPDHGWVQYVSEEITDIAKPGLVLHQGQVIARYARSGTGIEFGWSTLNGITLAVATTGYEEGQITPAGHSIRVWLNKLGAKAGPDRH